MGVSAALERRVCLQVYDWGLLRQGVPRSVTATRARITEPMRLDPTFETFLDPATGYLMSRETAADMPPSAKEVQVLSRPGLSLSRARNIRVLSRWVRPAAVLVILLLFCIACAPAGTPTPTRQVIEPWVGQAKTQVDISLPALTTPTPFSVPEILPPTRSPDQPYGSPTPDPLREPPATRDASERYVVRYGDSLGGIALRYGVAASQIVSANSLANPNLLTVGQVLLIPAPIPRDPGPSFKILPDSEFVYGPSSTQFDLNAFVVDGGGALNTYVEEVEGRDRSGAELVQLVSQRYSVDPRLLLAILEVQSSWLSQAVAPVATRTYPMGFYSPGYEGLFSQLSWAADQLNSGFYRWRAGWAGPYILSDGTTILPGSGINAGTAAVQSLFALLQNEGDWRWMVGEEGFFQTYVSLFGNPFDRAVDPLVPPDIKQPAMQLPFEPGKVWSFTGGPHGAWGEGSAWAALDFAPPGNALGCMLSNEWIVAVADGKILRSDNGEVIEDLDGDGFEQTGWVVLYMHVEDRGRVQVGDEVKAGDRIGHPSCEGGIANGTHVHLARKYNGEWIPADADLPFILDGWVSAGLEYEYDGTLSRDGVTLEACSCRNDENQIWR
jgi:LasA protease